MCAKAMGIANQDDNNNIANQKLLDEINQLNIDLEVPSLEKFGVEKKVFMKNINKMAEQAIASGSPNNNPIIPSHKELVSLYKKLWL